MVGISIYTFADSYIVTAKVAAPLPTTAPTITSPADQTHVSVQRIAVQGVCPANTYVNLYLNNTFSGTTVCGPSDTTYSVDTDLAAGPNTLLARVFNITDDEGPAASPVTVYYDVPPPPATTQTTTPTPPTPTVSDTEAIPTVITQDYNYWVYNLNQPIVWRLTINKGVNPYVLGIEWGDGTSSTITQPNKDSFEITHTYHPTTVGNTNYTIKIQVTDAVGAKSSLQLSAVVRVLPGQVPGGGSISGNSASGSTANPASTSGGSDWPQIAKKFMWIAWPSYVIVTLMAVSFWLGERQEAFTLFHHAKAPRRPRPRHS